MISTDNNIFDSFTDLIERIVQGKVADDGELFPFLSLESKSDRYFVNRQLAHAYYILDTYDSLGKAKECIKKAWLLSGYSSEEILDLYVKIHHKLGDIPSIKDAYKRIGIYFANQNDISIALRYFNLWHYAYANFERMDIYDYDADILSAIEKMAEPFRFEPIKPELNDGKARIAYLAKGILEPNSVLVKINSVLAKYHDKEKFEITFYLPESEHTCNNTANAVTNIVVLNKGGCKIIFADEFQNDLERLLSIAKKIYENNPHLLVVSAALSYFEHYFISVLKPASLQVCLNQGPVAQFSWHNFDYAISWFYTNVTECPIDTSCVPLEFDLDYIDKHVPKTKAELGIPENAIIVASGGRTAKFQDYDFWNAMGSILEEHPMLYYVVLGFSSDQVPFIKYLLKSHILDRVKFFPWSGNYLDYLSAADFVVDSYPTGGGVIMIESMALGKPILSFHHDFVRLNDGSFGSAGDEVLTIAELLIDRGNFEMLKKKADALITSPEERNRLGQLCKESVYKNRGNAERMTRRCEEIYTKLIDGKLKENLKRNFSTENNSNKIKEFGKTFLQIENFKAWQNVFHNGYNSSMGDHSTYFYNKNLSGLGLYDYINSANTIIEYGAADAVFMKKFIDKYPAKNFVITEYSTELVDKLKNKFSGYNNVEVMLNHPEISSLSNIDLSFSFLLSQSMPRTLWKQHLENVRSMLSEKGSYIFQFAYHPNGFADDQIQNGIYGNNKYKPEEVFKILEEVGYKGCDLSDPITLEKLNSDIIWYLCKAY